MALASGQLPSATALNAENGVSLADPQATSGTTTSTTYTATLTGGTACGVAFVAPASGKVLLINTTRSFNSTTAFVYCTVQVREGGSIGSGTIILTGADAHAHVHQTNTQSFRFSAVRLLTGLTPGNTYNAQQLFRGTAGTLTYAEKELDVIPMH